MNKTKMEAKLLFFLAMGELNLKTNKSKMSVSTFGGVQCLYRIYCGNDTQTHMMNCQGYWTQPPPDVEGDGFGRYLLELHCECSLQWKWPLIHVRTWLSVILKEGAEYNNYQKTQQIITIATLTVKVLIIFIIHAVLYIVLEVNNKKILWI